MDSYLPMIIQSRLNTRVANYTCCACGAPCRTKLQGVLGELVQTTAGKWITHPPTRCPNGIRLVRTKSSWGTSPASDTAAEDTPAGIA
jgi:hypothetical protein